MNKFDFVLHAHTLQKIFDELYRIESILKKIDGFRTSGEDTHTKILEAASIDNPDVRPSIISSDLKELLIPLKGFRHVARKRYAQDIKTDLLIENVDSKSNDSKSRR
jgi:hypothetical protein